MSKPFMVNVNNTEFKLDAVTAQHLDWVNETPNSYHLINNRQSYKVVINAVELNGKQVQLEVNGTKYSVDIADAYDQLIEQMGLTVENTKKSERSESTYAGLGVRYSNRSWANSRKRSNTISFRSYENGKCTASTWWRYRKNN